MPDSTICQAYEIEQSINKQYGGHTMGFFSFSSLFAKKKTEKVGQTIIQMLAGWDPESASQADLEQMEKRLDKLVQQVAEARLMYRKEQEEADAINTLYNQRLKAAEILQAKQAENTENDKITEALNQMVSELEEMLPEIKREEDEAKEAKLFMEELEDIAKYSAEKLKNAKKELDKAMKDMKRAEIREERSKERESQAAKLAGLRNETDQLGNALSAMKKTAEDANARASASNMKAKLIAPSTAEKTNELIASAMKEAKGGDTKSMSITDRLAALKQK
jgi:DNA repair exonuclease SbcCD ATPase subunit